MYDIKFKEYKSRQAEILIQMQEHNEADKNFYMTACTVLDLAKRAYDIFKSSEPFEKRQLVNFLFQNSRMNGKKWLYDLKEPFDIIAKNSQLPIWQGRLKEIRTYFVLASLQSRAKIFLKKDKRFSLKKNNKNKSVVGYTN